MSVTAIGGTVKAAAWTLDGPPGMGYTWRMGVLRVLMLACLAAAILAGCSSGKPADGGEDALPDDEAVIEGEDGPPDLPGDEGEEILDDGPGEDPDPGDGPEDADLDVEEEPTGPPEYCGEWEGLSNLDLVTAIHAHLHEAYVPIEARPDAGGVLNRYTTARNIMFVEVEWAIEHEAGRDGVACLYTGTFTPLPAALEPDNDIVNCEHVFPRSAMDPDDTSLLFSHQESDIHNLFPVLPGVNSSRGSFPFGVPVSDLTRFTDPDDGTQFALVGLDAEGRRVFQPRALRQGDVARVVFYFSVRWGKDIPGFEEDVLRAWYEADPADDREQRRNEIIALKQGDRNPFVDCPGLPGRIDDFAAFEILDTNETLPPP